MTAHALSQEVLFFLGLASVWPSCPSLPGSSPVTLAPGCVTQAVHL